MSNCRLFFSMMLPLLLVFLCGCMSFEYTGREFSPLTGGKLPKFYRSVKNVPAGTYAIIGRGVLVTDTSTHMEDIIECLRKEGAERGADAVAVVSTKKKKTAFYVDDSAYDTPSDSKVNPFNLTPDGAEMQISMTGKPVNMPAEYFGRVQLTIKVLFYKKKAQLEKIVSEREKQLDKLISKPQALPGTTRK